MRLNCDFICNPARVAKKKRKEKKRKEKKRKEKKEKK